MSGNRSGRPVCKFWQQGRCNRGANCAFEHPGEQNSNRFAPLTNQPANNAGARARSGGFGGGDRYRPGQDQKLPYYLSHEAIKADLTKGPPDGDRPLWPLSSYGPGRDAPRQLLEGIVEQSPEEIRLQYYTAQNEGKLQEYLQNEATLIAQTEQQAQSVLNDLDSAIKYVIDGENQHPNRIDQVVKSEAPFRTASGNTSTGSFGQRSAFGQPSQPNHSSAFGQPSQVASGSTFGQPSQPGGVSAFGQPSKIGSGSTFGQPSQPGGGSAFGQPSQVGSTSAFGQSSQMGSTSAFGQPSQVGATSAFGKPSQIGSSSGSAFGQPSAIGAKPAFGQPSQPAFGQPSQPAFGQPSQPAFGQPSQPAFGQSAFGQAPRNPAFGQSTFGQPSQPSPFSQAAQAAAPTTQSTFGQPSQSSPFGQSSQPPAPSNTFGQPSQSSPFGASAQNSAPATSFGANGTKSASPFGQAAPSTAPTTGFGGTASQASAPAPSAAAGTITNGTRPQGTGISATTSYATRGRDGTTLQTWKGRPVTYDENQKPTYRNQDGKAERIWHPNGPPEQPNPYAEAETKELYLGDLGAVLKAAYEYVAQHDEFKDGIMPEIPPSREWLRWDL